MGAGPWAERFHAPMLAGAADLELVAVWARRRAAAEELAGRFGASATEALDDLLDRCDVVAFAVPPDVQADLALRAAEAGRLCCWRSRSRRPLPTQSGSPRPSIGPACGRSSS